MDGKGATVYEQRDLIFVAVSRVLSTPLFIALALIAGDDFSPALIAVLAVGSLYTNATLALAASRYWDSLSPRTYPAIDLVALAVVMALSGGPESQVVIVYFIWPIGMSLGFEPREVALWLLAAMASYGAVAAGFLVDQPVSLDVPEWRDAIASELSLAWIGATTVGTAYALSRRRLRIERLAAERRHLLADAIGAEERTQRRLFRSLQDDTLETLRLADRDLVLGQHADDVQDSIGRARARIRDAVGQIRNLIRELHPAALRHGGLAAGLDATVERAVGHRTIDVDLRVDPSASGDHDALLISIGRDLADDAVRRAHAKDLELHVGRAGDDVVMEFRPAGDYDGALSSPRARAEAAGGRLDFAGDRVTVTLPLTAGAEPDLARRFEHVELIYTAAVRASVVPLFVALVLVEQREITGAIAAVIVAGVIGGSAQLAYFSSAIGGRLDPRPWILFDLGSLAWANAASGGPESPITIVYFIWPLAMALLYAPRLVMVCTLAAMVVFGLVSVPFVDGGPFSTARPEVQSLLIAEISLAWIGTVTWAAAAAFDRRQKRIESYSDARQRVLVDALDAEDAARRRLSQALHDDALQVLLAAGQDLDAAARGSASDLERGREELRMALARLRDTAEGVHPDVPGERQLAAGLEAAAERAAKLGGLEVETAVEADLGGSHDALVIALARELATNAAKHSGAARLSISVSDGAGDGAVMLRVADDGCGMDDSRIGEAIAEGHIGLASCIERAEAAGGRLVVEPVMGGGTAILVDLPAGEPPPIGGSATVTSPRPSGSSR